MKTLSLVTLGLITFATAVFAAPGGSGIGATSGTAATVGNGGHATGAAPAAHVAGVSAGAGHSMPASTVGRFRSTNPVVNTTHTSSGGYAGMSARSPGNAASLGAPVRALPTMPTVRNAWSDPANSHVAVYGRNAQVNNLSAGQHLNPGAYSYAPANRPADNYPGRDRAGRDGYRRDHRRYYNNFPYAVYYPYFYGGVGYEGAVGDYTGLTAENSVPNVGAPDFSDASNGYYTYAGPTEDAPNPAPPAAPAQALPEEPAVGPQTPSTTAKSSPGTNQQGPDSLVEAVQDELSKRGYFAGKPDALYSDATRDAIRRFQTDLHLPATGRINEATLHALHLD